MPYGSKFAASSSTVVVASLRPWTDLVLHGHLMVDAPESFFEELADAGLDVVSPETLLTSDTPRRPVRDAYVDAAGGLWVLSSGVPPAGSAEAPGGWRREEFIHDAIIAETGLATHTAHTLSSLGEGLG